MLNTYFIVFNPRKMCGPHCFAQCSSGKTSEYTGNYRPPTTGCMASRIFDCGTEFPDSLSEASMYQNLAAPNMYCTEYCHTGTGWPVRATVHPKNDDTILLSKHTACYQ